MKFFHRLRALFQRDRLDAEMTEEMRLHLELQTERNIALGQSPEDARYAARREFGGVEQIKERCRDQHRGTWLDRVVFVPGNLLRHGYLSLRRSPVLAITIVLTLSVVLGACVVVFAFLNSFLLRPLPYGDASRLVVVNEHSIKSGRTNAIALTYDNVTAVEERMTAFSRLAVYRSDLAVIDDGKSAEVAMLLKVNAEVFPLLGARAALGSVITSSNVEVGGLRTVVLSDALWRRRFDANPAIIGRVVRIGDQPYHVVGVMPPEFVMPLAGTPPDAWPALRRTDYRATANTPLRFHIRHGVLGELAPGHSVASANDQLTALAAALRQQFPTENADRDFFALPLREFLLAGFGRQLLLLQGAVLLVLVVACFNCLCLLIARAIQRRREFAVRIALGATRRHLLAQLFAESLWLALPASALALAFAVVALPGGMKLVPTGAQFALRSLPAPELDATVVGVVVGTAMLIALGFSALPLLQTRRLNLEATLREGGRSSGSPRARRTARVLVAGQIAVALTLLISATLLVQSQRALQKLDVGLPLAELDLFHVGLREVRYTSNPALRLRFFERFREQLLTLPGVREVGVASYLFAEAPAGYQGFVQEGDGIELSTTPKQARPCYVLPSTFSAIGLRLREGRLLADTDILGHPPVIVVSASLADRYWPGQSAVGQRVRLQNLRGEWAEVVGVVSDVFGAGNQPRVLDVVYLTIAQGQPPGLGMGFFIRHHGAPPDDRSYARTLQQLDPMLQISANTAPTEIYARAAWQSRLVTQLVAIFAFLAVGLALAGIYAVNSFLVALRIPEFGIRGALGATRQDLLRQPRSPL